MDQWMEVPGARVEGHRATIRHAETGARVVCGCGLTSLEHLDPDAACLVLALHLQAAVRAGAQVVYGDDDGLAGVREPRRPLPPDRHLEAEVDIAGLGSVSRPASHGDPGF